MGFIELNDVSYALPGGWTLFEQASFRVPNGEHAALVGANGIGKSTLLRLIAGLETPVAGQIRTDGRVGLMRQFIGSADAPTAIRRFLLAYSEPQIARAADDLERAELDLERAPDEAAQLAYANALTHWEDAGGYRAEVLWDKCTHAAFGQGYPECAARPIDTLSGGERKRLALEVIFGSTFDVILLDEPDNTLDIDGKRWLEETMNSCTKTTLFVSHDRTVLAHTATRIVTLEGRATWTHAAAFETYADAREARLDRIDEEHRRYRDKHDHLETNLKELKRRAALNDKFASLARSAEKKLAWFEERNAPTERPAVQDVRIKLGGGRTGKLALRLRSLSITGTVEPFDAEVFFGERVGVIGPNGTGKTHFLRLLAGDDVVHRGEWMLGARVTPALFAQLHERPDLAEPSIVEIIQKRGLTLSEAMSRLKRYELERVARNPFTLLSGGQQARFQLLLMEIDSPTMLLLDEPTDNLDVASADALEEAIKRYEGTVIAVTHDRWFMRQMDRFLFFAENGSVLTLLDSPYEESRQEGAVTSP